MLWETTESPAEIKPEISVVIPSYNEGPHLHSTLKALSTFLKSLNRSYEILLSDDGSTDSTSDLDWSKYSSELHVRYIRSDLNTGKGGALRRALLACRGNFVFFTDADLPIQLEAFAISLNLLENSQCDMIIGDRGLADSKAIGSAPIHRYIVSKLLNILLQLLILPGFTDTQCPMKSFTTSTIKKLVPITSLNSYAFDAELLYLAKRYNLRVIRIPVCWRDTRKALSVKQLVYITFSWLKDLTQVFLQKKESELIIKMGSFLNKNHLHEL